MCFLKRKKNVFQNIHKQSFVKPRYYNFYLATLLIEYSIVTLRAHQGKKHEFYFFQQKKSWATDCIHARRISFAGKLMLFGWMEIRNDGSDVKLFLKLS